MPRMNTTEVVAAPSKEISAATSLPWNKDQVELIKTTVAKGATDNELKLFLYTAQRTGLDPLTKQIHFVKRAGQMSIQTGIDGYRAIAERTGSLAGIDDAVYDVNAETQKPSKASVTVHRFVNGQKVSFSASARWSEYAPTGGQAFMWNKMPFLMLGKCAEALALRKAFPNDLSGVYTNEEMQQADNEPVQAEPVQVEVRAVEADPVTVLKQRIYGSLLKLRDDVNKDNVAIVVKELTGLELVEENFSEIDSRLAVLVDERQAA